MGGSERARRHEAFEAGSPPPQGYIAWHEWAAVQGRAGLKQRRCPTCKLFRFPQELSTVGARPADGQSRAGFAEFMCLGCRKDTSHA